MNREREAVLKPFDDNTAYMSDRVKNGIEAHRKDHCTLGGLIRKNLTPKPAYHRIRKLFGKRWHTHETLHTGNGDSTAFKGFYGEYDVKITHDGKTYYRTLHLARTGGAGHNPYSLTIYHA